MWLTPLPIFKFITAFREVLSFLFGPHFLGRPVRALEEVVPAAVELGVVLQLELVAEVVVDGGRARLWVFVSREHRV